MDDFPSSRPPLNGYVPTLRDSHPTCLLGALEEATAHEARQDQGADDGNGQGTQVLPATKTWNSHGFS